jgi:hypothetical protein
MGLVLSWALDKLVGCGVVCLSFVNFFVVWCGVSLNLVYVDGLGGMRLLEGVIDKSSKNVFVDWRF